MKLRFSGRHAVIGAPYLWLLLFFLLPFVIVLRISVSEMDGVQFSDLLSFGDGMKLERERADFYNQAVNPDAIESRREGVRARNRGA